MDSTIIISDESDSDNKEADIPTVWWHGLRRQKLRDFVLHSEDSSTQKKKSSPQDIIDLTANSCDLGNISGSESEVIDLTEDMREPVIKTSPVSFECNYSSSDSDSELVSAKELFSSNKKLIGYLTIDHEDFDTGPKSVSSSSTYVNSGIDSLDSLKALLVDQSESPRGRKVSSESNNVELPVPVPILRSVISTLNNTPLSDFSAKCSAADSQRNPADNANSSLGPTVNTQHKDLVSKEESTFDKAWLYKLRCYRNPPIHHLFCHRLKQNEETRKKLKMKPQQIPLRRMNFVESTMEENFPQGTLHFLNEFVSMHYYPPTTVLCHVVSVLLESEESGIRNDAYTLLMKVQRLHPANQDAVTWYWDLLSNVVENKEQPVLCLFLQYVVQTLEDDFQLCLQRRCLHTCLSKVMLSWDKNVSHIRDVIKWLIKTINDSQIGLEGNNGADCDNQRIICLLQRMLSIAVEVDLSPFCTSTKIAVFVFPYVICLTTRHEREMFLSSIESALLRARVIEVILQHSCPESKEPPLSAAKILYFLLHSTLFLEEQDPESKWQRSDEFLHLLIVLFLSYQQIKSENLLTRILDRIDELARVQRAVNPDDDITERDIDAQLDTFKKLRFLENDTPPALTERLHMLHTLLCTAVLKKT
ncbi:SUMO-interacting motif-containing protein 1 isoform X2 [Xenopus laevis]|uniref:SUMO-interacting motif-containing protein 1 isoform X2 n=1 Tax=Xenopus laevis TaxID=8355 RepID=A0A8J0UQG1_XENLA|nr:SUMO-interacting motif-containing protein 1 isoform X2 [Xenopus laevis]